MLAGVILFIALATAAVLGTPSSNAGEGFLKYYSGQATLAYTFYGLTILVDILLVPVVLALYLALRRVNRNAMLTAAVFGGLALTPALVSTQSTRLHWSRSARTTQRRPAMSSVLHL